MQENTMNVKKSIKGTQRNWIKMQTETFINWININLHRRGMAITDIESAFEDGVKLVNLFEVVSKKSIGKYAKNPKFHTQKMENVALVLKAMENDGVKVVSIDSECVVKGNFKMILGLVWLLVLRYQVGGGVDETVKVVLKKLLLFWLQYVIPDQNIRNLTTDWNDGIALCNLVNSLQPGLCPEYINMDKETPIENVKKGLELAESAFGIPQIISPEYMASPNVDDLSMTTYLSYFTQDDGIGEKWTSNLVKEWNPQIEIATNFNTDWSDGLALSKLVNTFAPGSIDENELSDDHVHNCRTAMDIATEKFGIQQIIKPGDVANPKIPELAVMAYVVQFKKLNYFSASGHGLVEAKLEQENNFQISFPEGTVTDSISVVVLSPHNQILPVQCEESDTKRLKYKYIPKEPGNYTININYEGQHISRSPYLVHVLANIDPYRIRGINDREHDTRLFAEISEKIGISVDTNKSGTGILTAATKGPNDVMYPTSVIGDRNGVNTISFRPAVIGEYVTDVMWNDNPIPQSPFIILVSDPHKCVAKKPSSFVTLVTKEVSVEVSTIDAGPGFLTSYAEHKDSGEVIQIDVTQHNEGADTGAYSCSFTPRASGDYILHVNYSECPIAGSPFNFKVCNMWYADVDLDPSTIEGEVLKPFTFPVRIHDERGVGEFECFVTGPSNEIVISEIVAVNEGEFRVTFTPLHDGEHSIDMYYMEEILKHCPYKLKFKSPEEEDPGTELFAEVNEKIGISIDPRNSSRDGTLSSDTSGPQNINFPTEITYEKDCTYTVSFTPTLCGYYETNVYWNESRIKGSPFSICVCDPTKCILKKPLATETLINREIYFEVLTVGAGPGSLKAHVQYKNDCQDIEVAQIKEECYSGMFEPNYTGEYALHIKYNESPIPGSPYDIIVCDLNNISVNLDSIQTTETRQVYYFDIHISDGIGLSTLNCIIKGTGGEVVTCDVDKDIDIHTVRVSFLPMVEGYYDAHVFYGGVLVNDCSYSIYAVEPPPLNPPDPTRVVVTTEGGGPLAGITNDKKGFINDVSCVTIDVQNAGEGELKATVEGPHDDSDVDICVLQRSEGIFDVSYTPVEPGNYFLNVMWGDEPVPGSPFKMEMVEKSFPELVVLDGKGLTEGIVGQSVNFTVDGRNAGYGEVSCKCRAPSGKFTDVSITRRTDDRYKVELNVMEVGLHTVDIKWGERTIPGSPFTVKIMYPPDIGRVKAYGPGLTSGVIETFEGIFYVDTKGGGQGALKVRVNGPKQCFKVKMSRNNPKDRIINVQYNPTCPGIYTANVFWSDEHIAGSPFEIFIASKDKHLEKWNRSRNEEQAKEEERVGM